MMIHLGELTGTGRKHQQYEKGYYKLPNYCQRGRVMGHNESI